MQMFACSKFVNPEPLLLGMSIRERSKSATCNVQAPNLHTFVHAGQGLNRLPTHPKSLRCLVLLKCPAIHNMRSVLQLPALEELHLTQAPGPANILSKLPASCEYFIRSFDQSATISDAYKEWANCTSQLLIT